MRAPIVSRLIPFQFLEVADAKLSHIPLGTLVENLLTLDHVEHRLGDVGGVVADPLDVLGAEQQMRAEPDVARILHHVGQQFAEQRGADGVDLLVAASRPPSPTADRRAA